MFSKSCLAVCLAALALPGCGSNESSSHGNSCAVPSPVRIFGAAEAERHDPVHHTSGVVVGPGSGRVTLLRARVDPGLPLTLTPDGSAMNS